MGIQLYFASRIDNVEATIKNKELPVGHEEACSVPTFKNVPYNKMYADDDESSKERFFDSLSEGDIDELSNQLENDLADPKELKKEKKPIPATNIASNIAALEKVNVVLESESEAKAKEYVTNSHYGTFATFGLGVAMMELGRADPGLKGQLAALKNLKEQVAKEKLIACNPAQQEALEAKLGLVSARESQVDAGWDGLQQYLSHGEVTQPASLFSPTIDLIHNPSNPMIMGGTSVMTARPFVVKPLPVFVPKPIF